MTVGKTAWGFAPVIALASTKGGVGKTTLVYSLATEFTRRLKKQLASQPEDRFSGSPDILTTCIDVDPNQTLSGGLGITNMPEINSVKANSETILAELRAAQETSHMIFIDLEGTPNQAMLLACGRADLVLIPAQPSKYDVVEAVKTAGAVKRASELVRQEIRYRVVLSRTPVLRQRVSDHSRSQFIKANLKMLTTELVQRTAFQTMTYNGLPPFMQDPRGGASLNVEELATEVLGILGINLPAISTSETIK